jgi:hypothetical protein
VNRTRLDPLGVPGADYAEADAAEARGAPNALDRWLVKEVVTRMGPSPVRAALWDEPDITPRDGTVRVRILDRKALWQLVVHPDIIFGHLYRAGRIEFRGDLVTLIKTANS